MCSGSTESATYARVQLGYSANFNRVLELARGSYFMWVADHDLWEPGLVSRCVAALEADPAAVLAYRKSADRRERNTIEEMDDQIDSVSLQPSTATSG